MDVNRSRSSASGGGAGEVEVDVLRLLIENTLDYAIFMLDVDGRVASWNAGAQRIKGYTAEEIIGQHFSIFYPREAIDNKWPEYELAEAARVGRFEDEGWRLRKDGTRFWANVVITALRSDDGVLHGYGKVTRDLTERREHERRVDALRNELERRVIELAATNRELTVKSSENESFVYSVSHDLRSPLVNLQGFSQELKLATDDLARLLADPRVPPDIHDRALRIIEGDVGESIEYMRNAVRHLSNIIDGLLRLSRVGRIEYRLGHVDMNAVVADMMSAMHATIDASGAEIRVAPLPMITADRSAAGQVIANILGNALKCLDASRPALIEISASPADPPVFSIRDNGVGIAKEFQRKIFQVFQHVQQTPSRGEGMGLAIVRRIVERHGGTIWFESTPGVGTTFHFVLGRLASADSRPSTDDA